jgi:putative ABC transport system permease protein
LGFYDKEVDNYINKESIIFTLIGIILGLIFGTFLTKVIVASVEIDSLKFIINVKEISYVYSAIITASFSFIVNGIIHFALKKIDMIESLKSVE